MVGQCVFLTIIMLSTVHEEEHNLLDMSVVADPQRKRPVLFGWSSRCSHIQPFELYYYIVWVHDYSFRHPLIRKSVRRSCNRVLRLARRISIGLGTSTLLVTPGLAPSQGNAPTTQFQRSVRNSGGLVLQDLHAKSTWLYHHQTRLYNDRLVFQSAVRQERM